MEIDRDTLLRAMKERHAVRRYTDRPLAKDTVVQLEEEIALCNAESGLHIQLVTDEPQAFRGWHSYGTFHGVRNYLLMVGPKDSGLDERVGYYGERLVLLAQVLGLNTCWVGMSYRKMRDVFTLADGERVACAIALGYGITQGKPHKTKTVEQVSNASVWTPQWFREGVEAALLAPSSVNQQKYHFEYEKGEDGVERVRAEKGRLSLFGYLEMDLGIAKYHFEIGSGRPLPVGAACGTPPPLPASLWLRHLSPASLWLRHLSPVGERVR